ncbi:hypothetical protein GH877_29675 [Bacillus thuringiensis]|nr:hypothetical protein [Bacillus thuringiensis]MRC56851.1 hypothetical protein [Bacillus thuringiensis]
MTKRNYLRYFMKESSCNVRLAMESYVSLKNHCEQMGDCGKAKVKKEKAETP